MPTRLTARASMDGADGEVVVHALMGREALSEAYTYALDATIEGCSVDACLGGGVHVLLNDTFGVERHVHGVVTRIELCASDETTTRYRVHIAPPHAELRWRHGFRVFRDLSVPDVVKKVLADAGIAAELTRFSLGASYAAREQIVQYDECEWDFVCRLLEHEGLFFSFVHDAAGVVMVISDDASQAPELDPLVCDLGPEIGTIEEPTIRDLRSTRRAVVAKIATHDYDLVSPSLDLKGVASSSDPFAREAYLRSPGATVKAEATRYAERALAASTTQARVLTCRTDTVAPVAGTRLELLDHPIESGSHLVIESELVVRVHDEEPGPLRVAGETIAQSRLVLVADAAKYRPRIRTPRPKVGFQTARVTGPSGEEIHCDDLGRVKLQFHWDREGQLDDKTSRWIRTSQAHTTGSIAIPRVGWEVIVGYYEGDPDRPICFGRLYEPLHPPEYSLPEQKAVSGLRSASSPGAGAVNEVSMDDAAGRQVLLVNAGKDLVVRAANDKKSKVAANVSYSVKANRKLSIGGADAVSVKGGYSSSVAANQSVSVAGNLTIQASGGTTEEVAGSASRAVGAAEYVQAGSAGAALLEALTAEAIGVASGAAAGAVAAVEGAVLGPIAPAVAAAREAVGSAGPLLGSAAALLSGGSPAAAVAAGAAGEAAAGESGTAMQIAEAAATGKLADLAAAAVTKAAGPAGKGGSGAYTVTVGGSLDESIGSIGSILAAQGIAFGVGGSSKETIGAARLELIRGGKTESAASKSETVAAYMVKTSTDVAIEAKGAVAISVASQSQTIAESHHVNAKGLVAITAPTVAIEAGTSVTLTCGQAEVVISGDGISIKGATKVVLEGKSSVKLAKPAIGPG